MKGYGDEEEEQSGWRGHGVWRQVVRGVCELACPISP